MIKFYLLTMLDSFNTASVVVCIITFIAGVFLTATIIESCDGDFEGEEVQKAIKMLRIKQIWWTFIISMIVATLLPSTKQAAFIYIAPQIVENGDVKDNVKNIPELAKLGTDYLKEMLKEKVEK